MKALIHPLWFWSTLCLVVSASWACAMDGECASDEDCESPRVCRNSLTEGNLCVAIVTRSPGASTPVPDVEIVSFTATPTEVDAGEPVTLRWDTLHARSCALEGVGDVEFQGDVEVRPGQSTLYKLSCQGENGPAIEEVAVGVRVAIPVFEAEPETANEGELVTFRWETRGAVGCTFVWGDATERITQSALQAGDLSMTAGLGASARLTCEGLGGPVEALVDLPVAGVVSLTAAPSALVSGQTTRVSWETSHLTGCTLSGAVLTASGDDFADLVLTETASLSLGCTGFREGDVQRDIEVPVLVSTFTADLQQVAAGESAVLRWLTDSRATSCELNGEPVPTDSASYTTSPLFSPSSFVLSCEDALGRRATSDPLVVTVL